MSENTQPLPARAPVLDGKLFTSPAAVQGRLTRVRARPPKSLPWDMWETPLPWPSHSQGPVAVRQPYTPPPVSRQLPHLGPWPGALVKASFARLASCGLSPMEIAELYDLRTWVVRACLRGEGPPSKVGPYDTRRGARGRRTL